MHKEEGEKKEYGNWKEDVIELLHPGAELCSVVEEVFRPFIKAALNLYLLH